MGIGARCPTFGIAKLQIDAVYENRCVDVYDLLNFELGVLKDIHSGWFLLLLCLEIP